MRRRSPPSRGGDSKARVAAASGVHAPLPQREATLVLEDGSRFTGVSFGYEGDCAGEGATDAEKEEALDAMCPNPKKKVPCGDGLTCGRSRKECDLTLPARRDSAEDFSRLNALLCTAMDWILITAYCFANS